jgi:hypothetical protein
MTLRADDEATGPRELAARYPGISDPKAATRAVHNQPAPCRSDGTDGVKSSIQMHIVLSQMIKLWCSLQERAETCTGERLQQACLQCLEVAFVAKLL